MSHAPEASGADAHLVETKLDSEAVFDGALLHVRRDTVRLPTGRTATREYVVHPGAVLIAPRLPDGRWIVERQFRYPVGRVFLEFPAGKRDPGESALDTGRRELAEEAGYVARAWTRLGVIHPVIGYSDEAIELWRADGLEHVGRRLDEDEHLDILAMSGAELLAALDRGEITDAKTVAALFFLERGGGVA
ncbi:ADP-ribose pyrophosphatase [Burkholderiales bacterium]|nr:ADP-ribose pyrophosphatase [Burkholderiales bacterium]